MLDHPRLKQLAREISRPIKQLIALAEGNDPFLADRPGRQGNAEWFASLWDQFEFPEGTHLRRIHYRLVSQPAPFRRPDGSPYENTEKDWSLLVNSSRDARYLNLVDADTFVDRRNPDPMVFFARSHFGAASVSTGAGDIYLPREIEDFPDLPAYGLTFGCDQEFMVEVWIEKSGENDWLVPLCRRRNANLVAGIGEESEVQCRALVNRAYASGKATRILYMSDFDPAGRSMPVATARKVEFLLRQKGLDLDVVVQPIMLTPEQCEHYDLPRTPIKDGERRKDTFESKFGIGATELDALESVHPGEAARIVEAEIDRYFDPTLESRTWDARRLAHGRLREIEDDIHDRHATDDLEEEYAEIVGQLSDWEGRANEVWSEMARELVDRKPDISDIEEPRPRPTQEPEGFVLFDSKRDYLTQLDAYHEWQRRDGTAS